MASKSKTSRLEQKAYLEEKLDKRLSFLSEKGIEPGKIPKDTGVKKIRAQIRETDGRLKVISDMERKVEEMTRIKAEKMAAPKKEKEKNVSDEVSTVSKRKQKKKKKLETKAKE